MRLRSGIESFQTPCIFHLRKNRTTLLRYAPPPSERAFTLKFVYDVGYRTWVPWASILKSRSWSCSLCLSLDRIFRACRVTQFWQQFYRDKTVGVEEEEEEGWRKNSLTQISFNNSTFQLQSLLWNLLNRIFEIFTFKQNKAFILMLAIVLWNGLLLKANMINFRSFNS